MKCRFRFIISMVLIFVLLSSTTVFAESDMVKGLSPVKLTVNEYDALKMQSLKSEDQLIEEGYSNEDVEIVKNYKTLYREHIASLNDLDDNVLKSFGYTDEQIVGIRNFKGTEAEMAALSATCNFTASAGNFVHNTYTTGIISFSWNWTGRPFATSTDLISAGWNHFAIVSRNCTVRYYDMTTGAFTRFVTPAVYVPEADDPGVSGSGYKIVLTEVNDFAKEGSGFFSLRGDVQAPKDCYWTMAYGHTVLTLQPSFSVGLDGVDPVISFGRGMDYYGQTGGRVIPTIR